MVHIPFFKMTGSGNDFIVIDNRDQAFDADNSKELVRLACRRKMSVGADGLIFIERDPDVDFRWRFFNADGSEAEMCGNGSRCAARFAYIKGVTKNTRMSFRTLAGVIQAELMGERVKVRMTPPHGLELNFCLDANGRPMCLHFINTGVPHVVHLVDDREALERANVLSIGRELRNHPKFQPAGTNVNFALINDRSNISVRTYERGVESETLACGTGSIASALVAAGLGSVSSPVDVLTASGEKLTIYFEEVGTGSETGFSEVYLEGDARVVYEAELWDETIRQL